MMREYCFVNALMFSLCLAACNHKPANNDTKVLDFRSFTIRVPQSWKRVDEHGIDSFVGTIAIDSVTSVWLDLGWYSNKLEEGRFTAYYSIEGDNVYIPDSCAKQNLKDPTVWKYFGKATDANVEKLRHNKISWINIDGYKAKLITPKIKGIGETGIYIDSLWVAGDDNDRFVLSAANLNPVQQKQLITAIKTLEFRLPATK